MTTAIAPDLKETLKELNLTEDEYQRICTHMEREPNFTELAMFSVLWSEHCCYKNSRHLLKKLPNTGARVLQGPGENAGVVDMGDGIEIAFKIESHNHPTAIEPYQGAATGVGGILRDIFTMNARPIANLNALRFGPQSTEEGNNRNRYLFTHAVKGIGDYGNCVGVPTIAGEVFFDDTYSENPLVNAMAIGIMYTGDLMASGAKGVGNPVLYVGSATGKDGMGGAAFASRELDEKSGDDRPAVQVGDPFAEKLLIEACLEAFATGLVVAAQDMGAAGLTSSSCEMASKGNVGMLMDLDKVPAREPDMEAFEYMLSESQERMLFVLEKGKEQPVLDIFKKWRLPAVVIGEVTDDEQIRILHKGKEVVSIPAKLLTDLAPSYERGDEPTEPEEAKARRTQNPHSALKDISQQQVPEILEKLFKADNIAQPVGVFSQYDRHVRNNTVLTSDHIGAGVIKLRQKDGAFSGKALAATTDCNPRYVYLNPYTGTQSAVAEAARNLVSVGAEPVAVTDNLNFGNPEKAPIYHQLYYSIEGMRDACVAFETPVTGGNVSLYNEHSGKPILPAPVIGMVGLLEDDTKTMSPSFKKPGDTIAVVGRFAPSLGGSEYLRLTTKEIYGEPPSVDLDAETALNKIILNLIQTKTVQSVQDISMGGLLTTLIECTFTHQLGISDFCTGDLIQDLRLDETLFGETNGSYIVSFKADHEESIKRQIESVSGLTFTTVGVVADKPVLITKDNFRFDLQPLYKQWSTALNFKFKQDVLS